MSDRQGVRVAQAINAGVSWLWLKLAQYNKSNWGR